MKETGLYNPYTYSGKIVVDGVVTSAFTNDIHPVILGSLYKVVEIIYKTTGYHILGDSLHGVQHPWWAKVLLRLLLAGPTRLEDQSFLKSYFSVLSIRRVYVDCQKKSRIRNASLDSRLLIIICVFGIVWHT